MRKLVLLTFISLLSAGMAYSQTSPQVGNADNGADHLNWTRHNEEEVVKQDKQVVSKYRKAADRGDAEAQYNLGQMYYRGEGVPKDSNQAVFWYTKAAAQGHARAQYILGVMYYKGKGVTEDTSLAIFWFNEAADQGITFAVKALEGLRVQ